MDWTGFFAFVSSISLITGLVIAVVFGTRNEPEPTVQDPWAVKIHK